MSILSSPVFKYWPELNLSPLAQMKRFYAPIFDPVPVPPYLLAPYRSAQDRRLMPVDYSSMASALGESNYGPYQYGLTANVNQGREAPLRNRGRRL